MAFFHCGVVQTFLLIHSSRLRNRPPHRSMTMPTGRQRYGKTSYLHVGLSLDNGGCLRNRGLVIECGSYAFALGYVLLITRLPALRAFAIYPPLLLKWSLGSVHNFSMPILRPEYMILNLEIRRKEVIIKKVLNPKTFTKWIPIRTFPGFLRLIF